MSIFDIFRRKQVDNETPGPPSKIIFGGSSAVTLENQRSASISNCHFQYPAPPAPDPEINLRLEALKLAVQYTGHDELQKVIDTAEAFRTYLDPPPPPEPEYDEPDNNDDEDDGA